AGMRIRAALFPGRGALPRATAHAAGGRRHAGPGRGAPSGLSFPVAAVNAMAATKAAASGNAAAPMPGALLRVDGLRVEFGARAALCGVTFDLHAGECLGLVGESGSGKSTLARAILRLVHASQG